MARGKFISQGDSGLIVHAGFSADTFGGEAGVWRTVVRANAAFGAIAGGASLGLGLKALTLPAGAVNTLGAQMRLALQQTEGHVTANTPAIGLGTTVASGAVSVLSGTAAFQNILAGVAAADADGSFTLGQVATNLVIPAANSHDVHVNIAAAWAASGDAALGLRGEFVLLWAQLT
jgi:hypothetical protein